MNDYKEKKLDILNNAEKYHDKFYKVEKFRGPSLYFHRRTLEMINSSNFDLYLEFIYATLASWGMHRMGQGGSKMQNFDVFKNSIMKIREQIEQAREIDYQSINDADWKLLKTIFCNIKVMASGTSLVGNSKVMAHLLPNIIPPIDREYTLRYLKGNTNIKNEINVEWDLMREIIENFFIPVARNSNFTQKANNWIDNQSEYPWDTSIFKVIDNLIIGAGLIDKEKKKKRKKA
ncbi:MAG: hypothetical protein LWW94_10290 [Candidatus Desulfofervidaceae bacterium]|nr:hypothetical protein [Candidatus Desulfofervidaceae bacterium]